MGLFDKFTSAKAVASFDNEQDAYAAIMFAVMASDGEISRDEVTNTIATITSKKLFAGREADEVHLKVVQNLKKFKSIDELLQAAITKISPEQKEPLFATLVDMVLTDGVVNLKEQQILEKLQESLSINNDLATKIIEVLLIKNRG